MFREAEEVADLADLQHDEVPGGEHVVEIVRVDPEQDRGHSSPRRATHLMEEVAWCGADELRHSQGATKFPDNLDL